MRTLQETLDLIEAAIENGGFDGQSFIAGYVMAITTSQLMYLYQEIMDECDYSPSLMAGRVVVTHLRRELGV